MEKQLAREDRLVVSRKWKLRKLKERSVRRPRKVENRVEAISEVLVTREDGSADLSKTR